MPSAQPDGSPRSLRQINVSAGGFFSCDEARPTVRPLFHPSLVNGRFGDPALYVETQFESRAVLFDIGDIAALSPRKIQRIEYVFVSHAHIDHFIGFDLLLRLSVGREKTIRLFGPEGFIDRVHHKLQAYNWNLAGLYTCDLVLAVTEVATTSERRTARFRLKTWFAREDMGSGRMADGIVAEESTFRVSAKILEHRTPCLGYALKEAAHANVWKSRLAALNLPVGPWLRDLKRAVIASKGDDYPIRVSGGAEMPLGALREVVTITEGQKIGYITDVADTDANRRAIVDLVRNADVLFIEAAFAEVDSQLAAERAHLTTAQAGQLARAAGARRIEPFHFSPRYTGEELRMLREVEIAFCGPGTAGEAENKAQPEP